MKKLTIREQIAQSLGTEPMAARDLSKALRISEKDVYSHTCRQFKKASGIRENRSESHQATA